MSPARLDRFVPAARGDRNHALRLYIWNARLCEKFYLPIQLAEVTMRNAIHHRFSAFTLATGLVTQILNESSPIGTEANWSRS